MTYPGDIHGDDFDTDAMTERGTFLRNMMPSLFRSLSLRARFLLGAGVVVLPLLVSGVVSYVSLGDIVAAFDEVSAGPVREMDAAARLQVLLLQAVMPPNDYLISGKPAERETFHRRAHQVAGAFRAMHDTPLLNAEQRAFVEAAEEAWRAGAGLAEALLAIPSPVGDRAAAAVMERMDAEFDRAVEFIEEVHRHALEEVAEQTDRARRVHRRDTAIVAAVFLAGLLLVLATVLAVLRSVLAPIRQLDEGVARLTQGDLSHRIARTGDDELARLAYALNTMAANLEEAQRTLVDLSTRDGLTGVLNRRELERLLETELGRARRYRQTLCVLMVDLDHFKTVNDRYGHRGGDEVLRHVATTLGAQLRATDHVARYGGEEFAVILPHTTHAHALDAAERIRAGVAALDIRLDDGRSLRVTASVGAACYPANGDTLEAVVAAADQALYSAKDAGRNRVCAAAVA